jgi:predicted GH43/DUF377 family glycosyl hydrolase
MTGETYQAVAPGGAAGLFLRAQANPVLTPADWPYPVNAVFNPGAALVDGQTVLLCRVEDRRGISHLAVARSQDGYGGWKVDAAPLLAADPADETSCWGVEDPRITRIDEMDGWLIAYTAYGPAGPCVALAITQDFHQVEQIGIAMPPEDKNASLLSRHVDGKFVLFHRPASQQTGRADVWLSRSTDLRSWTTPEAVLRSRSSIWWDSVRVGVGPPPLDTPEGWLCIYHGVRNTVGAPIYRAGLVLLDRENPTRVLRRSEEWILAPQTEYERIGDVPNTVFPTGLVHDTAKDQLRLYYGAADTTIAVATASLPAVMEYVLSCPAGDAIADHG